MVEVMVFALTVFKWIKKKLTTIIFVPMESSSGNLWNT